MPKSRGSRQPESELSRLEMEVMDEVWKLGECSSSEVIEAFSKRRPLAPTTVRTVLSKLKTKGYVEAVPSVERGVRIQPIVARESVVRRALDRLRQDLFGGSPREAIAYLLAAEEISGEELDDLRLLIEARRKEKNQ